jgi:hypothetical protein
MLRTLLLVFSLPFLSLSQTEVINAGEDPYINKDFLILLSTKKLDEAEKFANAAAKKIGCAYRDTRLAKEGNSVTFPVDSCKTFGFDWPCYVARGRWDDGGHISVELSDAYDGFSKGYFIVIAASGYKDNEEFKNAVKQAKKYYPKSYAKRTRVYIGCMH